VVLTASDPENASVMAMIYRIALSHKHKRVMLHSQHTLLRSNISVVWDDNLISDESRIATSPAVLWILSIIRLNGITFYTYPGL
jgi:hypothetical protein